MHGDLFWRDSDNQTDVIYKQVESSFESFKFSVLKYF